MAVANRPQNCVFGVSHVHVVFDNQNHFLQSAFLMHSHSVLRVGWQSARLSPPFSSPSGHIRKQNTGSADQPCSYYSFPLFSRSIRITRKRILFVSCSATWSNALVRSFSDPETSAGSMSLVHLFRITGKGGDTPRNTITDRHNIVERLVEIPSGASIVAGRYVNAHF